MTDERKIAASLAQKAATIVSTERGQQHGDLEGSFTLIAEWWNSYIEHNTKRHGGLVLFKRLDAVDVLEMMALVKKARNVYGQPVPDHTVDDIGYTALAGGLRLREQVAEQEKKDIERAIQSQGSAAVEAALSDGDRAFPVDPPVDAEAQVRETEPPTFSKRLVDAITPASRKSA